MASSSFLSVALALLAGCAAPLPAPPSQTVEVFFPDSDQLESRCTRELLADGSSRKTGEELAWDADGMLVQRACWAAGLPAGTWTSWYLDGTRASECSFDSEGRLDGECGLWAPDGRPVLLGGFSAGRPDGAWSGYHLGGAQSVAGRYVEGEPHGRWTAFHASGGRAIEGSYLHGTRDGLWMRWDERGEVLIKVRYSRGEPDDPLAAAALEELALDPALFALAR